MAPPRLLVIAATERELRTAGPPSDGWTGVACGVGPVEAAAATAAAIAHCQPRAILHLGIAGARDLAALPAGTVVLGVTAVYEDLADAAWAPNVVAPDAALLSAAAQALPTAPRLAIGTSARVGGTRESPVEAMEGFAVLRAAARALVPALEVRVIANAIGEPDRTKWAFDTAFATLERIAPVLIRAVEPCAR